MKKTTTKCPSVDLGTLQNEVEGSAKKLKAAQSAFLRASQALEAAQAEHDAKRVAFAQACTTIRSATSVSDLFAR